MDLDEPLRAKALRLKEEAKECATIAGVKIFVDPAVPLGMMEIHYPDGRRELVRANFP